jgi:hypothetical protein
MLPSAHLNKHMRCATIDGMSRKSVYVLVTSFFVIGIIAMWVMLVGRLARGPIDEAVLEKRLHPPIAPSAQVVAFVGHVKSLPDLALLEDKPVACRSPGKPPGRPRSCTYRAGDIEVDVSYGRDDGELRWVAFQKPHLDDMPPITWVDLANVLPWVCPEVTAGQAAAIGAEGADQHPTKQWFSRAGVTSERPEVETARREIYLYPHRYCNVHLVEQIDRGRRYARLSVRSIRPASERAAMQTQAR